MQETAPAGLQDIARTLSAAHAERKQHAAIALFESALRQCDSWYGSGGGAGALVLKAQTYAELALEQNTPGARTASWKRSLGALDAPSRRGSTPPQIAEAYAALAVDCFQDRLSDLDFRSRQQILHTAQDRLDQAISDTGEPAISGLLLSRKSSVLRHIALSEISPDTRLRRLGEAARCASLAVQHERNMFTVLELGLSDWVLARNETTDERYASRLRGAEQHLTDDLLRDYEPAQLALTRFYRLTFQPLKACAAFPRHLDRVSNVRQVLRDSYVLAEAAASLWFADYPERLVADYLAESRALAEATVAAGYRNARIIVALAYVVAIMEGPQAGKTALSEICTSAGVEWDKMIEVALKSDQSNLLELGLALGIDQSAVWTRLGTFVGRFLDDPSLAEGLYRAAVRLDPHDAIALTNLARFLVSHGGPGSDQEARRLIQKAQNFADRRFTWWRTVLTQLEHGRDVPPRRDGGQKSPTGAKSSSQRSLPT